MSHNPDECLKNSLIQKYDDSSSLSYQYSDYIFDNENQGQPKVEKNSINLDECSDNDKDNLLQRKTSRSDSGFEEPDDKIPLIDDNENEINLSDKYGKLDFTNKINFPNLITKASTMEKNETENKKIEKEKIIHNERNDNLRKETLKKPVISVKEAIEEKGKIKIQINLDEVFGFNYNQNRAILKFKIYEIFCINEENKKILEEAKPEPKDEIVFKYLLTRTYEFIYESYINNIRKFKIGKDYIEIKEFLIFNDIIEKRRKATKKKEIEIIESGKKCLKEIEIKKYNEKDMDEFIKTSKNYFEQLKNGLFDKRTPKKPKFLNRRRIDKFEDYINNENKSI